MQRKVSSVFSMRATLYAASAEVVSSFLLTPLWVCIPSALIYLSFLPYFTLLLIMSPSSPTLHYWPLGSSLFCLVWSRVGPDCQIPGPLSSNMKSSGGRGRGEGHGSTAAVWLHECFHETFLCVCGALQAGVFSEHYAHILGLKQRLKDKNDISAFTLTGVTLVPSWKWHPCMSERSFISSFQMDLSSISQ